jgi:hypothetical protein
VWLNASLAQYAQQVSAGFPQIINTINGEVNDTGLVGGLAFSAYTCTTSPAVFALFSRRSLFRAAFLSFFGASWSCATTWAMELTSRLLSDDNAGQRWGQFMPMPVGLFDFPGYTGPDGYAS